jgi:GTP cyclohydrolase I
MMVQEEESSVEEAVALLLRAIGEDPSREGLEKTPGRVARAMDLLTSGASKTSLDVLEGGVFSDTYEGMVLVQGIEFYSLCEHHLLPFFGRAHIAYLPAGKVIGLSRLPRLLDVYARRLQVQERLTDQVARAVMQAIEPRGVAVRLEAAHFCMMMRGVEKRESTTLTSSYLGAFDTDFNLRQEFVCSLRPAPPGSPPGPRESRGEARVAPPAATPTPAERDARVGVFAPSSSEPVPRGKYPQRVGPRPRLPRR